MGIGELASLTAAFMWTLSSMLWGRIHLSAMTLNLCKNVVGVTLVLIHIVVLAWLTDRWVFQAPYSSWGILALSGLIGIVIGDTMYFRSLQILGPRLALMTAATTPLFAAGLAFVLLGESIQPLAIFGIIMAVCGVIVVVSDRRARKESPGLMPGSAKWGVALGIAGATCQAIGGVFSKQGMVGPDGENVCDPIEASFVRILFAALATLLIVCFRVDLKNQFRAALNWKIMRLLIPATALGTWMGIWLSQIGYQRSQNVAVAQTLMATCPLFAIPVVWLVDKHRVTVLSIVGTVVALVGIFLTVYQWPAGVIEGLELKE